MVSPPEGAPGGWAHAKAMQSPSSAPLDAVSKSGTERFRCGTLVYTPAGLFVLFSWLLLGDFCFTLMEAVWPAIVPLVLKAHEAPNFVIAIVMTTIPQAMNFILNPIISTASDRFRSRLGRRIPFLLFSAPFISLFLVLLGFADQIGLWLHGLLSHWNSDLSASTIIIALICVFIVIFRFFELFVSTVFYYLFNDVVPVAFIGRFIGFFKVVGALAGALFHFFIFKYATSHTSVIFLGAAVLYLTAFTLMSLNVKEGQYPPPDKMLDKKKKFSLAPVKTFFRECYSARIFRIMFAYSALLSASGAINVFLIFMAFSIGLTIDQVGKVNGATALGSILLMFPMGILIDKFHPLRVMIVAQIGYTLVALFKCVFLFHDFSPNIAFWIYLGLAMFYLPFFAANAMAGLPLVMRIFPHERFGQFCAANAMVAAASTVIFGALAGLFLDMMRRVLIKYGDYYYRLVPAWTFFFALFMLGASFLLYREWKRLGGDKNYRPPIEDKFNDFHAPTTPPEAEA